MKRRRRVNFNCRYYRVQCANWWCRCPVSAGWRSMGGDTATRDEMCLIKCPRSVGVHGVSSRRGTIAHRMDLMIAGSPQHDNGAGFASTRLRPSCAVPCWNSAFWCFWLGSTIRVWETQTWGCERLLEDHAGSVYALTVLEGKLVSFSRTGMG